MADTSLFHLRMTAPDGRSSDAYFDAESYLHIRFNNKRVLDYRRVGSILFPFRAEGKTPLPSGGERHYTSTIVDIELNVPMDSSFFTAEK